MSFLSYLGFNKLVEDGVKALEPPRPYSVPETVTPRKPSMKEHKEYYRVGRTEEGMTTLTMIGDGGMTMTLTMNQSACKQMIRMLESTFDIEQPIEETQE